LKKAESDNDILYAYISTPHYLSYYKFMSKYSLTHTECRELLGVDELDYRSGQMVLEPAHMHRVELRVSNWHSFEYFFVSDDNTTFRECAFRDAVFKITDLPVYDHPKMMEQLTRNKWLIDSQPDTAAYIQIMEDMYNHNKRVYIPFR
jgi:hypothetical protein